MTEELYNKFLEKFTDDQMNWLDKNVEQFPGYTDDEIIANAARLLYANGQWTGNTEKEAKENGLKLAKLATSTNSVFDLQGLAQAAGFTDRQEGDTKISAAKQFLDAYFGGEKDQTTRDLWRAGIADKYGDGSWEKAKKILQRAENDRMNAGISEARRKEIDPSFSEASIPRWASSALMGLFTPRRKAAYLEGREPKWNGKESFGDIAENALYAAPVGKIAQGVKAIGKSTLASKLLGNLVAHAAPVGKIVQGVKAIGRSSLASKLLGNLVAQSVAPSAVVATDQALGNKDYTWDEALTDASIGTATNLGVNKGIARLLGPAYQFGMGKIRGRMPQGVVDFLEGTAPVKERAQEKVSEAETKLLAHYRETVGKALQRVAKGEKPAMLDKDELQRVKDIVELGDYVRSGEGANLSDALTEAIKRNQQGVKARTQGRAKEPLWQLDTQTLDEMKKPFTESFANILKDTKYSPQTEQVKRAVMNDPELLSLFYKNTPREAFDNAASDAVKTWAVNKYGSDKDAGVVMNTFGMPIKDLRKEQEKDRKERAMEASASSILGNLEKAGTSLTEEDTKWLKKIEQNPGMVQGYGEGNSAAFRNWMLLRGADLLNGTPLYRPAFEVE